jgi:hypothetical protein
MIVYKNKFITILFLFGSNYSFSQVKIGNNPTVINPKSILEIESTNKGVLIPRIALTATNNISPFSSLSATDESLLIYNTASTGTGSTAVIPGFYYWNGSNWVLLGSDRNIYNTNGTLTNNREINKGNYSLTISGAGNTIINGGLVGIETTSPKATLDVGGTAAMKVPVGNSTQRPTTAKTGMIRFNSTTQKLEGYNGLTWFDIN